MSAGVALEAAARTSARAGELVVPLRAAGDGRRVGGKASSLARLMSLGVPVPEGVVLTCEAFEAFLDASSVGADIERRLHLLGDATDIAALEAASREIRSRVMAADLPPDVDDALRAAAATLQEYGRLAVRSSAVGEDGASSSFAGQFESVLRIETIPDLRDAVRSCWASYWSARALFYRRARRIPASGMAVIVQRLVEADVAGVLFTRDPGGTAPCLMPNLSAVALAKADAQCTGESMVLEYGCGLADRLVAGETNPGRLYLSRASCAIAHEAPAEGDAAEARRRLTARGLRELGRAALDIERAVGAPQDIEWAIDAGGHLAIVQARTITALAPPTVPVATVLWSNANINENFPEAVTPLLYSIATAGYYHYFRNLGFAFGVSRRRLSAMDAALRGVIGIHGARLYYNLTSIHAVLRMAPFGERLASAFNLFVGAADTAAQPPGATSWQDHRRPAGRIVELIRIACAVTWQFLFLGRRLRAFERDADAFAARTTADALAARALPALGEELAAFVDIRCRRWKNASLCDTAAMTSYALLRWLLARHGFGDDTHTRLLRALPGVPSSEPPLRLWRLSRGVRSDPELRALFLTEPAATVLMEVQRNHRFEAFRRELEDYLTAWGFRSSGELMLTMPTLEEEPEPVIALLRQYVEADGPSPEDGVARLAAERRAETASIVRRLAIRAPVQALLIRALIRSTQRAVAYRERARLKQALLYTRCRRVALRIGDALVREGRLGQAEGVFMLTWQEIDELCSGRAMFPRGVDELVAMRRTQHAAERELNPPDTFQLPVGAPYVRGVRLEPDRERGVRLQPDQAVRGVRLEPDRDPLQPDQDLLRGATACGGRVSAPAAVLAGVHEAHRLTRGDVLVTRQTDPGWAPVFGLVSGLVIERGGMLSHGAIIAREFGLPCVVGVTNATERIPHGAMLTVDGDRGVCHVEGRP